MVEPSRLQPTYEELKLGGILIRARMVVSLQPTYEELKLYMRGGSTMTKKCLQPTYEELKLSVLLVNIHL